MKSVDRASARPTSALSPQVLQILLSLCSGPRHGYSIIQDIRERTAEEIRLTASTLYDALARLLDQGWIEEVDAPDDAGDSRRRYYALTRGGREAAQSEIARLERLVRAARAIPIFRKASSR
jgi:DNA-binding PadR family transcriptional regulator